MVTTTPEFCACFPAGRAELFWQLKQKENRQTDGETFTCIYWKAFEITNRQLIFFICIDESTITTNAPDIFITNLLIRHIE